MLHDRENGRLDRKVCYDGKTEGELGRRERRGRGGKRGGGGKRKEGEEERENEDNDRITTAQTNEYKQTNSSLPQV